MMRRTELKRTAWPRRLPPTDSRKHESWQKTPVDHMECAAAAIKKIVKAGAKLVRIGDLPPTSFPKEDAVRSEPYRRLVAKLQCRGCGIEGYSQAAHVPPDGKGLKQDDRETFALCCTRVGITGCHYQFDQFQMFTREEAVRIGKVWAAQTRRQIEDAGQWPKNLPKFSESLNNRSQP